MAWSPLNSRRKTRPRRWGWSLGAKTKETQRKEEIAPQKNEIEHNK